MQYEFRIDEKKIMNLAFDGPVQALGFLRGLEKLFDPTVCLALANLGEPHPILNVHDANINIIRFELVPEKQSIPSPINQTA